MDRKELGKSSGHKEIEFAKRMVWLMDEAIEIPVIKKRIGLDPLIGLIPIVGDITTALISLLIIVSLVRHGAPIPLILKMLLNVLVDFVIGGIPVIGDAWDFFFQSNVKNLKLLISYHESLKHPVDDPI